MAEPETGAAPDPAEHLAAIVEMARGASPVSLGQLVQHLAVVLSELAAPKTATTTTRASSDAERAASSSGRG